MREDFQRPRRKCCPLSARQTVTNYEGRPLLLVAVSKWRDGYYHFFTHSAPLPKSPSVRVDALLVSFHKLLHSFLGEVFRLLPDLGLRCVLNLIIRGEPATMWSIFRWAESLTVTWHQTWQSHGTKLDRHMAPNLKAHDAKLDSRMAPNLTGAWRQTWQSHEAKLDRRMTPNLTVAWRQIWQLHGIKIDRRK